MLEAQPLRAKVVQSNTLQAVMMRCWSKLVTLAGSWPLQPPYSGRRQGLQLAAPPPPLQAPARVWSSFACIWLYTLAVCTHIQNAMASR